MSYVSLAFWVVDNTMIWNLNQFKGKLNNINYYGKEMQTMLLMVVCI